MRFRPWCFDTLIGHVLTPASFLGKRGTGWVLCWAIWDHLGPMLGYAWAMLELYLGLCWATLWGTVGPLSAYVETHERHIILN